MQPRQAKTRPMESAGQRRLVFERAAVRIIRPLQVRTSLKTGDSESDGGNLGTNASCRGCQVGN